MRFVLKMMNFEGRRESAFAVQHASCVFKMMNFVFKMMDCALKMMDFLFKNDGILYSKQ